MQSLRLGYIPLAKANFDTVQAGKDSRAVLDVLNRIDQVDVVGQPVTMVDSDISLIIHTFRESRIDALLVHFCTFCLGSILPALAVNLDVPVILLGSPEPDFSGNRLRNNSFCALNMNSHTMYKLRKKYRAVFHPPEDPQFEARLRIIFSALHTLKNLKNKRIGLIGSRAPGFYTSNFNELKLREVLGVEVEHIDISKVYVGAEKIGREVVAHEGEELLQSIDYNTRVVNEHLDKLVRAKIAVSNLADEYRLDAYAIKCWPEFHVDYGIAVCPTLGMMNSRGLPTACEGDVYGAVTMMMQRIITGQVSFFADFIFSDTQKNTGLFWHCGSAPMELAEERSRVVLNNFSIVQEGLPDKGCVTDFEVYSKGKSVTINRIGTDVDDRFRILNITGEGTESEHSLRGNYCQIRFHNPLSGILDGVLGNGFEHHYSIVMEDISAVVQEVAFWKGFEVYNY